MRLMHKNSQKAKNMRNEPFQGGKIKIKNLEIEKKKLKGQHWELNLFEQWARNKQLWDLWL